MRSTSAMSPRGDGGKVREEVDGTGISDPK